MKAAALKLGLAILKPEKLNQQVREEVTLLKPDILVAVAYGKIFGPKFLALFPKGGVNLHPSLLPSHRGPAPIPAALINGDSDSGITIQEIALKMDAGDVLRQLRVRIKDGETTGELTGRLAEIGRLELVKTLFEVARGKQHPQPQDHQKATYCSLIEKDDGQIDWREYAVQIERKIRAFNPWPTAHTQFRDKKLAILRAHVAFLGAGDAALGTAEEPPGKVLRVDKREGILVQTESGILAIEKLQLQSRKALSWKAFVNGVPDIIGTQLGGD